MLLYAILESGKCWFRLIIFFKVVYCEVVPWRHVVYQADVVSSMAYSMRQTIKHMLSKRYAYSHVAWHLWRRYIMYEKVLKYNLLEISSRIACCISITRFDTRRNQHYYNNFQSKLRTLPVHEQGSNCNVNE